MHSVFAFMFACEQGAFSHTPVTIRHPPVCALPPTHFLLLSHPVHAPPTHSSRTPADTSTLPATIALITHSSGHWRIVVPATGHRRTHHALRQTLADCCASRRSLSHSSVLGNCMGKPVGVPVLTHTRTRDGSVPMSTGTGLVTGTEFGTRTRSGFDPRVCPPVGMRVVRVSVCE
jgi:hypothetical protein